MSEKIFKTIFFLLFIPLFRFTVPFFIKKASSLLGENLEGFFN